MTQGPSFVMSRSRIALATLITVSVLGSFYYHTRQPDKKADKDTLYNDFLDSLPTSVTPEDEANDFLGSLFKNASDIVPSTLEEFKSKMAAVYPAFERQLEAIRNMYSSFWDYLFLEDFRKIVKESLNEDDDVILHPEIQQEAFVREGQGLSEAELEFIKRRKERMRAAFAFFIGEDEVEVDDIPNIGIASR